MALKLVEKDFLTMFLVLYLCVIPINFASTSTSYKQFSTSSTPSLIQGVETVEELNPNTGFVNQFGDADMPFLFGVIHQFVTGTSNTLIGQIPCSTDNSGQCVTDVSFPFLTKYLGSANAELDAGLTQDIAEFHGQCYMRAYQRHVDASNSGYGFEPVNPAAYPNTSHAKMAFYGDLMDAYYQGLSSANGQNLPYLRISRTNGADSLCYEESFELKDSIEAYIHQQLPNSEYEKFRNGWVEFFGRYSGRNPDGSINPSELQANHDEARDAVVNAIYTNTVNNEYMKNPLYFEGTERDKVLAQKSLIELNSFSGNKPSFTTEPRSIGSTVQHVAISAVHTFTVGVETLKKMTELYIKLMMTPTIINICMGCLILFGPVVLVMSSYDPTVAYRLVLTYIGLAFSIYIFELSLVLTNNVLAIVLDYSFSTFMFDSVMLEQKTEGIHQITHIGLLLQLIPLSCVVIWNVILQILGGRALAHLSAGDVGETNLFRTPVYLLASKVGVNAYRNWQQGMRDEEKYQTAMNALDDYEKEFEERLASGDDPTINKFVNKINGTDDNLSSNIDLGEDYESYQDTELFRDIEDYFNSDDLFDEEDWYYEDDDYRY
ncbi:hypothetical protein [Vibrio agarivorans]